MPSLLGGQLDRLQAVGFFETVDHPSEGPMLAMRSPLRFSKTPCETRNLAPSRGKA